MPAREEYLQQPINKRLERLERTPGELADAIGGQDDNHLNQLKQFIL